jgi:hypothetical protein
MKISRQDAEQTNGWTPNLDTVSKYLVAMMGADCICQKQNTCAKRETKQEELPGSQGSRHVVALLVNNRKLGLLNDVWVSTAVMQLH